ncbi:MAG: site-2 protease family protein, partial [Thermoguttaceae bacterium]
AKPPLEAGDRIVMIDGQPVETYRQMLGYFAEHPSKPLELTVESPLPVADQKKDGVETPKLINVSVEPRHILTLGLVMTMGEVVAVQDGSPAAAAGIKAGDRIIKIDGNPPGDPMRLPERLRQRAGDAITLTVDRQGSPEPINIAVTLRKVDWYEEPLTENCPLSVPALGIAYRVINRVDQVVPGGPGEKAGIHAGAMIQQAAIVPPKAAETLKGDISFSTETFVFDEGKTGWPIFFYFLQQRSYPGSSVELTLENNRDVVMQPAIASDWFDPDRGFIFKTETMPKKARNLVQAIRWGGDETWDALTVVLSFLRKIGSQISVTNIGGPGTIAIAIGEAAQQGPAKLLLFLTLLSANLAVLNLLPIPLLDGGHLVFLCYEGIRGKPASERIQIALSVMGLIMLIALMLFAISMDLRHLMDFLQN